MYPKLFERHEQYRIALALILNKEVTTIDEAKELAHVVGLSNEVAPARWSRRTIDAFKKVTSKHHGYRSERVA